MRQRATLLVEVDLAETGELSTINHWRMLLQRQLDDFAGSFRPIVRGAINVDSVSRLQGSKMAAEQAAG